MKRNHALVIFLLALIASCTKDSETTPVATDDRDKFTGSWLCNEGSGTPFTIEITKLSGTNINIKNFSNYGDHANAVAEVSGNTLVISSQDFNDLPGVQNIVSSGSAIYSKTGSAEKIKMSYTVDSVAFNNVVCTR